MPLAHVSNKGQITLPAAIRRKFGIAPNSTVEVVVRDDIIIVRPLRSVMELGGVFATYAAGPEGAEGRPKDWEQVRTETERRVAGEVANE